MVPGVSPLSLVQTVTVGAKQVHFSSLYSLLTIGQHAASSLAYMHEVKSTRDHVFYYFSFYYIEMHVSLTKMYRWLFSKYFCLKRPKSVWLEHFVNNNYKYGSGVIDYSLTFHRLLSGLTNQNQTKLNIFDYHYITTFFYCFFIWHWIFKTLFQIIAWWWAGFLNTFFLILNRRN